MKKLAYIFLLPMFMMLFGGILTGCDDNNNFTQLHYLTDDELAELARQQRIRDSLLNVISADEVIYVELKDFPQSNWGSTSLKLDMSKAAELFELTEAEVYAGIGGDENAPKIQGFCIQGSTHNDFMKASTTNGPWGHWWTIKGDVCDTWNQPDSFIYTEWTYDWDEATETPLYETGRFLINQMPGVWGTGDKTRIIECLSYQKKRIAYVIDYEIIERGEVVATIVNTQHLNISLKPNITGSYEPNALKFDLQQTLSDLGVTELTPSQNLIAYKADGSWEQEIQDNGWWFDKNGYVGAWGSNASVWISYGYCNTDEIGVVVMPDNGCVGGDRYVINFCFIANNKIEQLEVTVDIIDGDDPNSAEVVSTTDLSLDIMLDPAAGYTPTPLTFDLDKALSDLGCSSLMDANLITLDKDSRYTMGLNADKGFWMDKSGPKGDWGENASMWLSYGMCEDNEIGVCLMPGATAVGDTYNHKFGFFYEGKIVLYNITVNVIEFGYDDPETAPAGSPTTDTVLDITLEKAWDDTYSAATEDVREALRQAFKMTTYQIYQASLDGSLRAYNKEITSEVKYTGNGIENWLDLNGDYANYGDGGIFCGLDFGKDYIELYAGNMPDEELCPQNSEIKTTYLVCCNSGMVTMNITIKIGAAVE